MPIMAWKEKKTTVRCGHYSCEPDIGEKEKLMKTVTSIPERKFLPLPSQ